MFLPFGNILTDVDKKEPLRASERTAGTSLPPSFAGSMTLEAALAVPLFVFFVMNLLFIFEAVRLQSGLQAALQQAGEQVCEAAYYTRFAPGSYLGDSFWKHSCVVGGKAGLSFAQSKIMTVGDRVEIIVNCRIRPFVRVVAFPDFAMQARYCGHAWVGWTPGSGMAGGSGGGNKEEVYVTTYGEVYHTDTGAADRAERGLCILLRKETGTIPTATAAGSSGT